MVNDKWNEGERRVYERLSKLGNGKDRETVDGLAYTAVSEMYMNRLDREKNEAFANYIKKGLYEMSEGICMIEKSLGINIHEMADAHFNEKMDKYFREGNALCKIAVLIKNGIDSAESGKVDIGVLEEAKAAIMKHVRLDDWKDVVSNAEIELA